MIFSLKRMCCSGRQEEEALNHGTTSDGDLNQGMKLAVVV